MNAKEYYEWAKHYDPECLELQFLMKRGIDFTDKRVLEVGCGTGRFTQRIINYVFELLAIDPDEGAIEVCREHIEENNMKIKTGTLETLIIPDDYYDYVVFSWSMYMINDKEKNIRLAYNALQSGGKLIVLQANSGEFEEEVANLYSHYSSLGAYENAYKGLANIIFRIFGNVTSEEFKTYFLFDNIEQVIRKSIFFVEDEEGTPPTKDSIKKFKNNLKQYYTSKGQIKMSDVVSVFIANK